MRKPANAILLLWVLVAAYCADAYDYDVQKRRSEYHRAKEELAQGLRESIDFDAQGRPVKNEKFAEAARTFQEQDAALRGQFDNQGERDVALDRFLRDAGVDRNAVIEASGSKPGSKDYRGFLGDRDLTITDQAQLDAIIKTAGGKARRFGNRITIEGLDCNIYFSETVSGVTNLRDALRDPEVVIKPTPAQQAKKIETHFRGDVPDDTGDQLKMLQEVSKSVYKADKAVKEVGGEGVLTDREVDQFSSRKAGQDAETELQLLSMNPEERKKFLAEYREKGAEKVGQSIEHYEKARIKKMDQLQQECDSAVRQSQQAADAGDTKTADTFNDRAREAQKKLHEFIKEEQVDRLTSDITRKKNPEFSEKVHPRGPTAVSGEEGSTPRKPTPDEEAATKKTQPGEEDAAGRKPPAEDASTASTPKKKSRFSLFDWISGDTPAPVTTKPPVKTPTDAPDAAGVTARGPTKGQARFNRGASWIGRIMAVYDAYEVENEAARKENRAFSWGHVTGNSILNLVGINSAWAAGQALQYEAGKGTELYIQRELKKFKDAGYDPRSFSVRAWIAAKAITRGTALGTYEGAKGLPMIGDVVSAPENAYRLADATLGLLRESSRTRATQAENEITQAGTRERALPVARASLAHLRQLAASISQQNAELEKMLKEARQAQAVIVKTREQLVADQEILSALSQDAQALSGNLADARTRIRQMAGELETIRTTADGLSKTIGVTIAQLHSQRMAPEEARSQLETITEKYNALQARCEELARRFEVLAKLAQPNESAQLLADARARTQTISTDLQEARAFCRGMLKLADVQRQALDEYNQRRNSLFRGVVYFNSTAERGGVEEDAFEQLLLEVVNVSVDETLADEALRTAQQLDQQLATLTRMAQKMPVPPAAAANRITVSEQIGREFQQLKDPALKADAALEALRKQLEKLRAAIGTYIAQLKTQGADHSDAYKPIPYKPQPAPETPARPETKKNPSPAPPTDYAALAAQCNAIYAASLKRRWAKWGEAGLYTLEVRKPWTWNANSKRFECDIAVRKVGPSKNEDPKTFKPYITSELGGAITVGQAEANIKAGKWFGE